MALTYKISCLSRNIIKIAYLVGWFQSVHEYGFRSSIKVDRTKQGCIQSFRFWTKPLIYYYSYTYNSIKCVLYWHCTSTSGGAESVCALGGPEGCGGRGCCHGYVRQSLASGLQALFVSLLSLFSSSVFHNNGLNL